MIMMVGGCNGRSAPFSKKRQSRNFRSISNGNAASKPPALVCMIKFGKFLRFPPAANSCLSIGSTLVATKPPPLPLEPRSKGVATGIVAIINMPIRVFSAEYGHEAIFHTRNPLATSRINDVRWTRDSIYVSSNSALNGPAEVWLNLPHINIPSAKEWCLRRNVNFLREWRKGDVSCGFGFAVRGFSRYRYVESESDDDDEQQANGEEGSEQMQDERRRIRTREAGRTPARRKVSGRLEGSPRASRSDHRIQEVEDVEPLHPRPRMMTPRFLLGEEEMEKSGDELDDGEERGGDGVLRRGNERSVDSGADTAGDANGNLPERRWDMGMAAQTPKMAQLRAALFEDFPLQSSGKERRLQEGMGGVGHDMDIPRDEELDEADVQMEDMEIYQQAEEQRYNVFESQDGQEALREAEESLIREAGELSVSDAERRKGPSELSFPNVSLPFPTIDMAISAKKEGVFTDNGLMLSRSTRVSCSHDGVLVRPQYRASQADMISGEGFGVDVQNIHHGNANASLDGMAQILRIHCAAWYSSLTQSSKDDAEAGTSSKKVNRTRIPSLQDAFTQRQVADATLEALVEQLKNCHEAGDVNAVHAHIAFWLLLALYKQGDDPEGEDELLRRVSLWAAGPACTAFDDEDNCHSSGLRSALLDLSLGSVESAMKTAIDLGHIRLALLIARALESPKDSLRADVQTQLAVYGLIDTIGMDSEPGDIENPSRWDRLLEDCQAGASVSIDEVMILMILAGHVEPVARFLNFSWYRLFIMELLYGAGASDLSQAERVSAAVEAVTRSAIQTTAPHNCAQQQDVVYHLLRLYADSTASYSLKSGVYGNGSFGLYYAPMDARFSWLLYQVLTAIVPRASTPRAQLVLADEFSLQLRASGLHLWSFYVLCTGGAPDHVLKSTLIRNWPDLRSDSFDWSFSEMDGGTPDEMVQEKDPRGMSNSQEAKASEAQFDAESFIVDVLKIPRQWVSEAKAVAAHVAGNLMEECEHWVDSETAEGASFAHTTLTTEVFPQLVTSQESSRFEALAGLLRKLKSSKHISNWSTGGGLILEYLDHIVGAPDLKKHSLQGYRVMVDRVRVLEARAKTAAQHYAAVTIANGIAAAERVLLIEADPESRETMLQQIVDDLERLPCSRAVKLRVVGEYKIEAEHGTDVAARFSAAYPHYSRYLELSSAPDG